MNRTISIGAALAVPCLAASLLAAPAMAQTQPVAAPGQAQARCLPGVFDPTRPMRAKDCYFMAEFNKGMQAEGLRTVLIGDRMTIHDDRRGVGGVRVDRYVNTVSMSADGSNGLQVEGNRRRSETSTEVSIVARLRNVRIYDASRTEIPQAAFLGGRFNDLVRQNAALGTRPMVLADTVHANPDGSQRLGLPLVVFGNVAGRGGSIMTAMPDLRPQELAILGDLDVTNYGRSLLSGPEMASLRP